DHLSYFQDAVATEAYLGTARRRTSVRRHARLVDYLMHEGCNARAWLHVAVDGNVPLVGLTFFTGPNDPTRKKGRMGSSGADRLASQAEAAGVVFEPLPASKRDRARTLQRSQNQLLFYTWGDSECCLPAGAVSAALDISQIKDEEFPQIGDLLLIEEVLGPRT